LLDMAAVLTPRAGWSRPVIDLADPGQKEAYFVTLASGIAAAIFWAISLYEEHHERSLHASVISFSLSSFIDLTSTAFVLWRFTASDALAHTPENAAAEARASVIVAISLILLAGVDLGFSIGDLAAEVKPTFAEIKGMIFMSLPSQAVYLVVGMLQLQIGCRLRSNSLTKDGVVTIFSAAAGMAQLTGAQIDITETVRAGWFWDPVLTMLIACGMFVYGTYALHEETRLGARWWRFSFWYSRAGKNVAGDVEGAAAATTDGGDGTRESTPFKK